MTITLSFRVVTLFLKGARAVSRSRGTFSRRTTELGLSFSPLVCKHVASSFILRLLIIRQRYILFSTWHALYVTCLRGADIWVAWYLPVCRHNPIFKNICSIGENIPRSILTETVLCFYFTII